MRPRFLALLSSVLSCSNDLRTQNLMVGYLAFTFTSTCSTHRVPCAKSANPILIYFKPYNPSSEYVLVDLTLGSQNKLEIVFTY